MEEVAAVEGVQAHTQDHVHVTQEVADSMTLLELQHWMVIERVVDGDMPHLLLLQEVELVVVAAVVVFVVQAAAGAYSEAVELVFAVVMLPAAEAETMEAEWNGPVSLSAKHKANERDQMTTHNTFNTYEQNFRRLHEHFSL